MRIMSNVKKSRHQKGLYYGETNDGKIFYITKQDRPMKNNSKFCSWAAKRGDETYYSSSLYGISLKLKSL
jgi:hypothetical protein